MLREACDWAASLRLAAIPADVRDLTRAQMLSQAAALETTLRHPVGARLVAQSPGEGWEHEVPRVALLTMALDFDETAFAGHLGHAAALPPLLAGAALGASGERVMTAQVAAAEVAARVTAAATLGASRGQTAAHTHAVAAVVGLGLLQGMEGEALANALALVLAQPRRVLLPAFMGSDAKFWVAAAPILDAGRALAAVAAGARGPAYILEAKGGWLEQLASVPLPEAMAAYGERWHTRTLSIKSVPGCAYLTAAVEAAATLAPLDLDEVEEVEVAASIFTIGMEVESAPYIDGPASPLPALGFSTGYNVATALESGALGVDDLHGAALASPARWAAAGRVRVVHDEDLTVAALAATAPLGAAIGWAGERARGWLQSRGGSPALTDRVLAAAAVTGADGGFERPSKSVGARLRVTMRDGRVLTAGLDAASGCCQESVAARLDLARRKHAAAAGESTKAVAAGADRYEEMDPGELRSFAAYFRKS